MAMTTTKHNRGARALSLAVAVLWGALLIACPDGAPAEDAGQTEADCETFCLLEDECGLRTFDACSSSSCVGGSRKPSSSDACIADAVNCAEVVLCTCDEACAKVDECSGSTDEGCPSTCETLVEQTPDEKYVENRCIIESACEDLSLCSN